MPECREVVRLGEARCSTASERTCVTVRSSYAISSGERQKNNSQSCYVQMAPCDLVQRHPVLESVHYRECRLSSHRIMQFGGEKRSYMLAATSGAFTLARLGTVFGRLHGRVPL